MAGTKDEPPVMNTRSTCPAATPQSRPGATVAEGEATTATIATSDLAAASGRAGSGGGGPPVGLIVGVVLVAGLGAAGVVIARRRSRTA